MRRAIVGCAVIAVGIVGVQMSASAKTVDASCKGHGLITISPGLTTTPQPQDFTFAGNASARSGCPALPTHEARFRGRFHSDSAYCDGDDVFGSPAAGRFGIQWPDGTTTKVKATLAGGAGLSPGLLILKGAAKSGVFVGDHFGARLGHAIVQQVCGPNPITTWYFYTRGANTRPLTFSHP